MEHGATRNFQAEKLLEEEEKRVQKEREDEELNNPMKVEQGEGWSLLCPSCLWPRGWTRRLCLPLAHPARSWGCVSRTRSCDPVVRFALSQPQGRACRLSPVAWVWSTLAA